MNLFDSWQYKLFGIWRGSVKDPAVFPEFTDVIDSDWRPTDRTKIIGYLKIAPVAVTSFMPHIRCEICQYDLGDSGQWQSDGVWLWPSGLAHFVEKHAVRLPDQMVDHIRKHSYAPPPEIDVDIQLLPWPKV